MKAQLLEAHHHALPQARVSPEGCKDGTRRDHGSAGESFDDGLLRAPCSYGHSSEVLEHGSGIH